MSECAQFNTRLVRSKGAFQESRVGDSLCLGASGAWRTKRGVLGREEMGWIPLEERGGTELAVDVCLHPRAGKCDQKCRQGQTSLGLETLPTPPFRQREASPGPQASDALWWGRGRVWKGDSEISVEKGFRKGDPADWPRCSGCGLEPRSGSGSRRKERTGDCLRTTLHVRSRGSSVHDRREMPCCHGHKE